MASLPPLLKYTNRYDELISLIDEAYQRVLRDEPDEYIYNNVNFFIKSFLVISCVYLETYLKEVGELVIENIQTKLRENPLPHNLIKWSVDNNKDKTYKFSDFKLEISKKDIDDIVSGNVGKTIILFTKLGVDIVSEPLFDRNKDLVATIVTKRNNIVHHNDEASDVSFPDVINYISTLKEYIQGIDNKVKASGLLE